MIRSYKDSDLDVLKQITVSCFEGVSIDRNIDLRLGPIAGGTWQSRKSRQIDADAAANPEGIFVWEDNGAIIGYITTRVDRESRIGWIPNMAVVPGYQGKGIGKALLERADDYLRREGMLVARIETLEQNSVGQHLYPKMGYVEVARQVHYAKPL